MRRLIVALTVLGLATPAGCTHPVDKALNDAHHAKYVADSAFETQMVSAVTWGKTGWEQKHALQRQIIDESFAIGLKANADAEGKVKVEWMLAQLAQTRKDEALLAKSQASADELARVFLADIAAYHSTNKDMLKTEDDALEAKRKADVAIDATLQGAGTVAATILSTLVLH